MYNNNDNVPNFEKFPGSQAESAGERSVPPEQDFEKAMAAGVPEFAGFGEFGGEKAGDAAEKRFGQANPENMYYGEAQDDGFNTDEAGEEYDAGIADAAALINYGLNAAARDLGVETVVQKIKGFDASGREDPIKDLFEYLGVDTPEEAKEIGKEEEAAKVGEQAFREGVNNPGQQRSYEGAFKALDDMKELIAEVEGADPRYAELRAGASAAGKGYFEYAVQNYGVQGLTELFSVLAQQREKAEAEENAEAGVDLEAQDDVVTEDVGADQTEELADAGENGNILSPEFGKKDNLEQRIQNGEQLNPDILKKAA